MLWTHIYIRAVVWRAKWCTTFIWSNVLNGAKLSKDPANIFGRSTEYDKIKAKWFKTFRDPVNIFAGSNEYIHRIKSNWSIFVGSSEYIHRMQRKFWTTWLRFCRIRWIQWIYTFKYEFDQINVYVYSTYATVSAMGVGAEVAPTSNKLNRCSSHGNIWSG